MNKNEEKSTNKTTITVNERLGTTTSQFGVIIGTSSNRI